MPEIVTCDGTQYTMKELAERAEINRSTLYSRWRRVGRTNTISADRFSKPVQNAQSLPRPDTSAVPLGEIGRQDGAGREGQPLKIVCPISLGRPTRMTSTGFEASCAYYCENEGSGLLASFQRRNCQACGGKVVPAEIEIISIKEHIIMSAHSVQCEVCGELKSCVKNHEKMMCSGCVSCQSLVRKRPEAVVQLLLGIHGKDYLTRTQRIPAAQLEENSEQTTQFESINKAMIF